MILNSASWIKMTLILYVTGNSDQIINSFLLGNETTGIIN